MDFVLWEKLGNIANSAALMGRNMLNFDGGYREFVAIEWRGKVLMNHRMV